MVPMAVLRPASLCSIHRAQRGEEDGTRAAGGSLCSVHRAQRGEEGGARAAGGSLCSVHRAQRGEEGGARAAGGCGTRAVLPEPETPQQARRGPTVKRAVQDMTYTLSLQEWVEFSELDGRGDQWGADSTAAVGSAWAEGGLDLTSEEALGNVFPGQTQLW